MSLMLERGVDQASGLRRSLRIRSGPVLAVAGAGEHAGTVGRIAQALADRGLRVTLVTDFDAVMDGVAAARSRPGLVAYRAHRGDDAMRGIGLLAQRSTLTLAAVDDVRLARGLALPASDALVLAGADDEALATAYARIKALVGLGSVREVRTVFGPGAGGAPARRGHARLAGAASRFLGVDLEFGGSAPDTPAPGAWRRLAEELAAWARGGEQGAAWSLA
jgi:hypothetical protein